MQSFPSVRNDGLRQCADCGLVFPSSDEHFYKRKRANGVTYLSSSCKSCVKAERQRARQADPEKTRAAVRANWEKHKEKYNARARGKAAADPEYKAARLAKTAEWRALNREYMAAYRIALRQEFGDRLREQQRMSYRRAPKERLKAERQNYKARKRAAPGRYSATDLRAQFSKQRGLCFWCGTALDASYHADHYVPLNKGGSNFPENIVLACPTCNTSRRDKMPDEFMAYLAFAQENAQAIQEKRVYMREAMQRHRKKSTCK